MGRRQYLERLALGRSAYQNVDLEQQQSPAATSPGSSSTAQEWTGHEYTQQYDSRGRPINPAIDRFNAEQRRAQNEVLALVGVVERKDETDHINGLRYDAIQKARRDLLADENERGELLDHAIFGCSFLLHLWPAALRQRIQIGRYHTSRSLVDILVTEWRQPWRGGTRLFLASLFPGAGSTIAHHLVRFALMMAAEQLTGELQTRLSKKVETRQTLRYLELGTAWVFEALLLAIDIGLLPLEYYAATQMLGLAPALPLFPSLQSYLPWHAESFHNVGWKCVISNRFIKNFASPAAILLVRKMLAYDAADSVLPVFHLITDFRFPEVDDDPSKVVVPKVRQDPLGWVLYQCYYIRSRFLQRSGWTLIKRDDPRRSREDEYEMHTRTRAAGATRDPIHRSTIMAQLPVQFLSDAIDSLFARILSLPFEALMMRTIATSFLASSLPRTKHASMLYAPFGGGPLTHGWSAASQYAGRIGLSLALTASLDVVSFFGIYKLVRSLGIKYLDWGKRGKIGTCIYSEEGVEERGSRDGPREQLEGIH